MDERYYERASRNDINFAKVKEIARTEISPLVSVVTKSYRSYTGENYAHIESFVCSKDPTLLSEHIPHKPFDLYRAQISHKQLCNKVRTKLGLETVLIEIWPQHGPNTFQRSDVGG